ncbi:cAMP-dependent protein kinase type I-alpha regulatory subunit [Trichinella pseudospiralis]|uniref:cAMP-dependent protein kinase type I-alpha regulatory subunit n=1 Tax=Trichinella pseudospiralis TaxID=6337 RepID=A0A0V1F0S9_TRIPS|nr:cAMP-dependent protein kinase type I-alpha regulatory subunit [Trichinella pseudospiralis]
MLPFSIMSSIFGKGNDDGLVMSHQSAWARLCEDYLERHNVSDLIKRALVRLCIAQPDDPVAFLSHYFQLLEKGEEETHGTCVFVCCVRVAWYMCGWFSSDQWATNFASRSALWSWASVILTVPDLCRLNKLRPTSLHQRWSSKNLQATLLLFHNKAPLLLPVLKVTRRGRINFV